MAPIPAMNHYEKMVKDAERAYAAASAAVAAEATASPVPTDYSPPNWRIMLGMVLGVVGIILFLSVLINFCTGKRKQISVDIESNKPQVVFVPPALQPPPRAATQFVGPPVSYRGYISQADLLKGKNRQDGFV